MTVPAATPPRLATWLLERLGPADNRESLIGDLVEQYQDRRSSTWYWRQAASAVILGIAKDIRDHKWLAVRALVVCWVGWMALIIGSQVLNEALRPWARQPWESEALRQLWVYYALPFMLLGCAGCAAIGWLVGRLHSQQRTAMVMLCSVSLAVPAIMWTSETIRLLHAGLFPFWDFRLSLLFRATIALVGYPVCLAVGGLWNAAGKGCDREAAVDA